MRRVFQPNMTKYSSFVMKMALGFLPLVCTEGNVASNLDSFSILRFVRWRSKNSEAQSKTPATSVVSPPRILPPLKTVPVSFSPSVLFVVSLALARVPKFRLRSWLFSCIEQR
jgi:hypothetical protein